MSLAIARRTVLRSILPALLLCPVLALAVEVPTRLDVRIPSGTNNAGAPGLYSCTGSGGDLSCSTSPGVLTDDAFIERIDFGGTRFDFVDGEIAAGLISVVVGGTDVNAEFGDDDDDSDGNADPFEKSGNPVPPGTEAEQTAFRETGDPAIRDPAIARALGDASISEGIDGESNNFTLRLDFQAAVTDDVAGPDGNPEILFFERGINSDTGLSLVFQRPDGSEGQTNELFVNRGELVDSGLDLDTLEIGGSQSLGVIGVDLSDFSGGGFDPATSPVIGLLFGSSGGGADYFGVFALSGALRRDFGDAPDGAAGTGAGNYQTRQADGGPRHLLPIPPTVYLGTTLPDSDDGTLANAAADADDSAATNDEDGILLGGTVIADQQLATGVDETITATLNDAGFLNVWIDLNRDGDFDDDVGGQSEHFVDDSNQSGATARRNVDFTLPIPVAANLGETYLRARFCTFSNSCDTPVGTANSGEVEDHRVELVGLDFGDAPDGAAGTQRGEYATTRADGGPAHILRVGGPSFGAAPDADDGTLQSEAADADGADEDGVLLRGAPVAGQNLRAGLTESLTLRLDGSGFVNAWLDLNRDGDFDDTVGGVSEHFVQDDDQSAGSGVRTIQRNITVPATVSAGRTYLRVRICSAAGDCATPVGTAADGEVEDHGVFLFARDYGDAPDDGIGTGLGEYETIRASNGPRHDIADGLFIGAQAPDADPGVLRNDAAEADDAAALDDEGGFPLPPIIAVASSVTIPVPATALIGVDATLYGWLDFDQSGTFDEDEAATALVVDGSDQDTVDLTWTLPDDVASGGTYLRLRLTTDVLAAAGGGVDERSLGLASDGEVEDLAVTILDVTFDYGDAPDVYGTLSASGGPAHGVDPLLRLGLNIDAETDGQPGILAEGDDALGSSDESAIRVFPPLSAPSSGVFDYTVDIRVRNQKAVSANLVGWIDFDGDGTFDADEAASAVVPPGTNGAVELEWTGLNGAVDVVGGRTYGRFRLSTSPIGSGDTGGTLADGEVEDYDLVIFGTEQCDIGLADLIPITRFDFETPTLEAGSALQLGARYRFPDITAGVDALVDITDFQNASLGEIDTTAAANGGFDDAFQPTVNLLSQPGEGYVEFIITLVKADTSAALEPAPVFLASAIDVDGDSDDARELVEFYKPFGTVYRENPSLLNITDTGSFFRFLPGTAQTNPGIDPTATESIATLRYDGTAQFLYRAGIDNDDGATAQPRLNSLVFGCIEFDNPQTRTIDVDFGDAPEPYPTLLADFPALHTIDGVRRLGAAVDAETEGLPSADARGDDESSVEDVFVDDEDGVTVGGLPLDAQRFTPGEAITFEVATVGPGLLSAWIDWNGNGTWADPGEQIAVDIPSTGGTINVVETVPPGAAGGTTYARFRYTSDVGIRFDGGATNGEVEDYAIVIARLDFGDAPDAGAGTSRDDYTTLESTGGPSHELAASPSVYLGALPPDADDGFREDLEALADDADGADDEDGLRLAGDPLTDKTLFRARSYDVDVTLTGGGYLNLWIDLNRDGDFLDTVGGVSEQVLNDLDQSANAGINSIVVPVAIPGSAVVGPSYVRARYCSTPGSCDTPTGPAPDGEVEDWRVTLAPVTADARISGFVFEDNGAVGGIAHDGLVQGEEAGLEGVDVRLLFDADGDGLCDGSESVLAQTLTAGDGSYALRPAQADQGKAACLVVETPPGFRSISESAGGNPVVVGGPFDDFATLVVPAPGTIWSDVDFGDIRLPRLTPDRQDAIAPGGSVSYLHFYDATTDATVDFTLGAINESPADIGWSDVLYRDADCSGDLSGSEPADPLTGVAVLAGERICLLVRTFAPSDAPPSALHARDLEAASSFTGTGEGNVAAVTDITTVIAGQLRLVKSVRNIGPDGLSETGDDVDASFETFNGGTPGDVLRYRIRFRNEGALPVRNLVVNDSTPPFTSLATAIACPAPLPPDLASCAEATLDGVNGEGYRGVVQWTFTGLLVTGGEGEVIFDARIDD